MFDPITTKLINSAPSLQGLDLERLPEEFTRAYAEIVSFRIHLARNAGRLPEILSEKLDEFRRMATTYEALVIIHPAMADRRAAAFVAAHAYHLLHVAGADVLDVEGRGILNANTIAPCLSALMLFLVAGQAPDAYEMAHSVESRKGQLLPNLPSSLLIDALCLLARGKLEDIALIADPILVEQDQEIDDTATEALYLHLLKGLKHLASALLDDSADGSDLDYQDFFVTVSELSVVSTIVEDPFDSATETVNQFRTEKGRNKDSHSVTIVSSYSGPNLLAKYLSAVAEILEQIAVSNVPTPEGIVSENWRRLISPIKRERPFLWNNHLEAIQKGFLDRGVSSVVSFPTGAGKTTLAALKIATALGVNGAAVYLAPTLALVSQTKSDLRKMFPSVEVRESLIADDFYAEIDDELGLGKPHIVVMTPERCLAVLSEEKESFSQVRLVVFDECHLAHAKEGERNRRSLDAMLVLLNLKKGAPQADWLLLSAMLANGTDVARWLEECLGKPCLSLDLAWKPTRQARGCVVYNRADMNILYDLIRAESARHVREDQTLPNPPKALVSRMLVRAFAFFSLKQTWQTLDSTDYTLLSLNERAVPLTLSLNKERNRWYPTPNKNKVAVHLAANCVKAGLKTLLFVQTPRDTPSIQKGISEQAGYEDGLPDLTDEEQNLYNVALEEVGSEGCVLAPDGCATSHHGSMLQSERLLSESVFQRQSDIKALVATATLAQGMNLPADVVIIVGDERFDQSEEGFAPLEPYELLNAAGRAGRAGLVAQGIVLVIPHKLVSFEPETGTIGNKWAQLRESVFSQSDQCLTLLDPIGYFIDKVQDSVDLNDAEVKYFFRRIPRDLPDAPRQFFNATFSAWQARNTNLATEYAQKVTKVIAKREEAEPLLETETWRSHLAFKTGIDLQFLEELHVELLRVSNDSKKTTLEWTKWFFDWLGEKKERIEAVAGHRLNEKLREKMQEGELFGTGLSRFVDAWMTGESLLKLNALILGKATKKAGDARTFATKIVPELAFAAGLAAQIRRHQIDESQSVEEVPVTLGTLALCVKEGVPFPELAALRLAVNAREIPMSRMGLGILWTEIQGYLEAPRADEFFGVMRTRVANAYARYLEAR